MTRTPPPRPRPTAKSTTSPPKFTPKPPRLRRLPTRSSSALKRPTDLTFKVKLVSPCPYFLSLCAFPTFYPVPQASVEAANPDGTNPGAWALEAGFVSNGAYTCTAWEHNQSMTYTKNPEYWDAENVQIETLQFMLSDDDTAVFSAYNAGDLDFIDTVPTNEVGNLIDQNPEFHVVDQIGTYYVGFNVNSEALFGGRTPEEAAAIREAISLLIDRQYIVDTVTQAGQQPANTFVPAGMSDSNGAEFRQNTDAYTYPGRGFGRLLRSFWRKPSRPTPRRPSSCSRASAMSSTRTAC